MPYESVQSYRDHEYVFFNFDQSYMLNYFDVRESTGVIPSQTDLMTK